MFFSRKIKSLHSSNNTYILTYTFLQCSLSNLISYILYIYITQPTINCQWHWLAQSPCNNILCPTGIVASIAEPGHTDNEAALTGDDEVYVPFIINLLTILLPKHLKIENRKVPKFSDTRKLCCNLSKIQTKRLNLRVFC